MQNIKHAIRRLVKNPGFALVAVFSLAIGIGANTAIFTFVNGILLRPLPFRDPDRVVYIDRASTEGGSRFFSPLNFRDLTLETRSLESAAAINIEPFNIAGKGEPEMVSGADVSWNFFHVIGVSPEFGRSFTQQEGVAGKSHVVIISHSFWQRYFAADPKILGSTLRLNGVLYTIAGVAPAELHFPSTTEIWRPLVFSTEELDPSQRGASWIRIVSRIKGNVGIAQAQQEISDIAKRLAKQYPRTNENIGALLVPVQQQLVENVRPALLVLLGAVGFVLLIACANVANLLLAQTARRESEIAIRTAIGAGRFQLMQQFLVEAMVLTFTGGLAGLLICSWSTDLLLTFGPADIPRMQNIRMDLHVFLFTFAASVITGLIVGLFPALHAARKDLGSKLQAGARGLFSGGRAIKRSLVIAEVALALMLLMGAGLLIKSFVRLQQVDPGFNPTNVWTFSLSLSDTKYAELHQISSFYTQLVDRLKARGKIESAAVIFGLPLTSGWSAGSTFAFPGSAAFREEPSAALRVASPDYFKTMQIPVLKGRAFTQSDVSGSPAVAIINESAAKRYWPGQNPIGLKIRIHVSLTGERPAPASEIVGVVGDVRYNGLDSEPAPEIYVPHQQHPVSGAMVVLRAADAAQIALPAAIREEVHRLDPEMPIADQQSMEDLIGASVSQRKFVMSLLLSFAIIATVLAAIGIYGVLTYSVAQRTREIGLRMALGAQPADVMRMIIQEGTRPVIGGIIIGLFGAFFVTRVLSSQLFKVKPTDPSTFFLVVVLLGFIAILSSAFPARRAMKVDPITALHYE